MSLSFKAKRATIVSITKFLLITLPSSLLTNALITKSSLSSSATQSVSLGETVSLSLNDMNKMTNGQKLMLDAGLGEEGLARHQMTIDATGQSSSQNLRRGTSTSTADDNLDTSQSVQSQNPNDDYEAFAENTLKIVANAQKQAVLMAYRQECEQQPYSLPGVEYSNFNEDALVCTLRCAGTSTFWNSRHNCVVRDKRMFKSTNQTEWLWHFGEWQTQQCYLGSSGGTSWFRHQGCTTGSEVASAELCEGCFTGCQVPPNTDIPLGIMFAKKTLFEPGEKVTFTCKEEHCWVDGAPANELHGSCYCNRAGCGFAVCTNGRCEKPDDPTQSILHHGCANCAGGRCIRPINARLCDNTANAITPRSDVSCTADTTNPRQALYIDRYKKGSCSGDGCNDYFMCAAFQTKAQSAVTMDEETVNVKRCWKDGSDQVLAARCTCYNSRDCDFIEVGGTNNKDLFREGCLVEFCSPDASFSTGVVAGGR